MSGFDDILERRGTGALKYDALEERYGNAALTPLWVADMDFPVAQCITDALRRRMEHPVFGYTVIPGDFFPAIADWTFQRHGWRPEEEWITYIPGVVKGIGFVVNVFTEPGDTVVIQNPVYHPFRLVPLANGRRVAYNPLIPREDGLYDMDFENLEDVLSQGCKVMIMANPHNPGGVVWSRETLRRVAEICRRHGVLVVSDEIHSDLVLKGHKHVPFASVSEDAAMNSITFAAPTKTFNIAGIVSSYSIIPNPKIREKFTAWLKANELDEPNMFAPIATIAAYRHGEEWRRDVLEYIESNIDFTIDFCAHFIPGIKPVRPEASYLVWLDCRELGLGHDALQSLFVEKAGLALNDGEMFGKGGEGHMRLNVACPRTVLEESLRRLAKAVEDLN